MGDIITPYMWSDNLSVDNALSSRQIIHQLITKINNLVELYNNLDVNIDTKIDSKLVKELEQLESELRDAIQRAFEQSTDYTDIAEIRINDKIEKLTKDGKEQILALENELREHTDTKVLELNTKIMELYTEFDKLSSNSFASISPLDGALKSNRDCFYDMLHVFQRQNGVTLDNIIAMMMYTSNANAPWGDILVATDMDSMLKYCKPNSGAFNKVASYPGVSEITTYDFNVLQMVEPTWGNIVSCGLSAILNLGKKCDWGGTYGTNSLGYGASFYNVYFNESHTTGNSVINQFTGTEFKPFDITKM